MNDKDEIYSYQPLWGKWYIELPIGKGSIGSVYKVSREEMGRKYTSVVKFISVPSDEQRKEAEAFLEDDKETLTMYFEDIVRNSVNRLNALYSLSNNTNILIYQDHEVYKKEDEIGWDILIRMEYLTNLKNYEKEHAMTRAEVVRLGLDICDALEICTIKGIMHRDVKDENIFVSEDGVYKLGGFEIISKLSKSGRGASLRGTPQYMAPEVIKGEKFGASIDIYSLGIMLYRLLNDGRMPFMPPYPEKVRYQDSEDALGKRISGTALSTPTKAGDVLSPVVLKACAYKPTDRYATSAEMKQTLQQALSEMSEAEKEEVIHAKPGRAATNKTEDDTKGAFIQASGTANARVDINSPKETFSETSSAVPGMLRKEDRAVEIIGESINVKKNKARRAFVDRPKIQKKWYQRPLVYVGVALVAVITGALVTLIPTLIKNKLGTDIETQENIPDVEYMAVVFSDNNLENAVREQLGVYSGDIAEEHAKSITELDLRGCNISDITGLEVFSGMKTLDLSNNNISDISPLAELSNLTCLYLDKNEVSNISALQNLAKLTSLALSNNEISDISALSDKTRLEYLYLSNNPIDQYAVVSSYYEGLIGTDFSLDGEASTVGNTSGNIRNGGKVALSDGWIYYGGYKIYKCSGDFSEYTVVSDDGESGINVVGDWVYYCCGSDFPNIKKDQQLYKVKTDGSQKKLISTDKCLYTNVKDDYVYYCNIKDDSSIYKIKTDGTRKEKLSTNSGSDLFAVDDWLYYINKSDSNKICRISTDGTAEETVIDSPSSIFNIYHNRIYYVCETDNKLYSTSLDGSNQLTVSDDSCGELNVTDEWIYYANDSDEGKLYKIRHDGSGKEKLTDDEKTKIILVAGDWIIYGYLTKVQEVQEDFWAVMGLNRVKTDGSEKQELPYGLD